MAPSLTGLLPTRSPVRPSPCGPSFLPCSQGGRWWRLQPSRWGHCIRLLSRAPCGFPQQAGTGARLVTVGEVV